MTEAQALEQLTQRWIDAWPPLQPAVPYVFDGEISSTQDTYAHVSFVHTVRSQTTLGADGGRKFEARGQIFVRLFGPVNRGVAHLAALADDVRKVYEGRRLHEDLCTYAGSSREVPSDGRWMQRTVTIPFVYHEQR